MNPHPLLALILILSIAPAGWTIGDAARRRCAGRRSGVGERRREAGAVPSKPAADRPATIQGKTIDEWLAALKDRDPAVRKRAVEVVGERSVDPAVPQTSGRGCRPR